MAKKILTSEGQNTDTEIRSFLGIVGNGATGPTGPTGPAGSDGSTGPTGPQGVAGTSVNWTGTWNPLIHDLTTHNVTITNATPGVVSWSNHGLYVDSPAAPSVILTITKISR